MSANAAVSLLAQMLFGITSTTPSVDAAMPDLSLDAIAPEGEHRVETIVTLATGDRYRVTVEWLREESP